MLLEGLKSDALASQGFSPLCLRDLQAIRTPAGGAAAPTALDTATARAIVQTVRARLADWHSTVGQLPDTPLGVMQTALQTRLQRADSVKGLEKLCRDLTGRRLQWRLAKNAKAEPAWLVAALLANGLPLPPPDGTEGPAVSPNPLAELIDQLRTHCGLRKADAAELLELLSPLWTPAGNAAMLADVAVRNRLPATPPDQIPPGVSVALQCTDPNFTIDQHVRRVLLPTTRDQVMHVLQPATSDNRLEELKHAVRAAVRSTLPPRSMHSNDDIDAMLTDTRQKINISRRIFFVVPDPLPDADLLADLQASFPRLTFILQSATPLPAVLPPRVVPLEPVPRRHELDMSNDLGDTQNLLGHPSAARTPP